MEEEKLMCGCGAPLGGNLHCQACKEFLAAPKKSKKDKKD